MYSAIEDPNPDVNGKGHALLRDAGIPVHTGISQSAAAEINKPFFKYVVSGQPWVTAKFAVSLDGKIAKETLKILNPMLASIPTANTNQSPNQSAIQKDVIKLIQLVKRRMGLEKSPRLEATAEERTWPDRGHMFATQPKLTEAALALQSSEALASLDFLDMDRLAKDIPTWLDSPEVGPGAFLTVGKRSQRRFFIYLDTKIC